MSAPERRRRAIVYVDGFNLYYGSLKKTPYRWLDLAKLGDLMLPGQDVLRVKYFTAIVDCAHSGDGRGYASRLGG